MRERILNNRHIGSNDKLDSSLKKGIEQSSNSTHRDSLSIISPAKNKHLAEMSKRIDSNDSDHRSSKINTKAIRPTTQYRNDNNELNENSLFNDRIPTQNNFN